MTSLNSTAYCQVFCLWRVTAVMQDVNKARQAAVDQMCSVASLQTVPAEVKTQVLNFLAVHAFFVVDKAAVGKVLASTLCFLSGTGSANKSA